MAFRRKSTAEKLEADIEGFAKGRLYLERRLSEVQAEADAVNTERRNLLLSFDAADQRDIAKLDAAARSSADRKASIEDALASLAERCAEAEAALAADRDRTERERVATDLEARAMHIRASAISLDEAADQFNQARRDIIEVVGKNAPHDVHGYGPTDAFIRGAAHLAGLSPLSDSDLGAGFPPSATRAADLVCGDLQARATAIRLGNAPADLSAIFPHLTPPPPPVTIPETPIILSRPVSYMGLNGPVQTLSGGQTLPTPVADACKARGIGFEPGSADGRGIHAAVQRWGASSVFRRDGSVWALNFGEREREEDRLTPPDLWLPLDVDLTRYVEDERLRLGWAA